MNRPLIWFALAVPALLMLVDFARGAVLPMDLLHPSGEMSVRLMIIAMLVEAWASAAAVRSSVRAVWLE